jgi:hypothetical protein
MTNAQSEAREERIAICMIDGGLSLEEAEALANQYPELYGHRAV